MNEYETFSLRLKTLREDMKMTQKEFSQFIGVKQQTLSGYERGTIKPPIDIAKNIAQKCHVSLDWLCGLKDDDSVNDRISTYSDLIRIFELLRTSSEAKPYMSIMRTTFEGKDETVPVFCFRDKTVLKYFEEWISILDLCSKADDKYNLYEVWLKDVKNRYNFKLGEQIPDDRKDTE